MKNKQFKLWFASLLTLVLGASIGGASALEKSPERNLQIELPVHVEPKSSSELRSSTLIFNNRIGNLTENFSSHFKYLNQFLERDNLYLSSFEHTREKNNQFKYQKNLSRSVELLLSQFNFYQFYKSPDHFSIRV